MEQIDNLSKEIAKEVTDYIESQKNKQNFPFFNYNFTTISMSRKLVRHTIRSRTLKFFYGMTKEILIEIRGAPMKEDEDRKIETERVFTSENIPE